MAVTFGFYNSINKDRAYNANQFSQIFDGVIRDGVYQGFPENKIDPDDKYYLKTRTGTGMQVILGPGRAWFDGTWTLNDADMPITISGSDYQADRIDTIVLKTDKTDAVRANRIYVEEGAPSDNPVPKTLTDTDSVHYHPLATIRVRAGTESIGPNDITIQVNNDPRTPFVTGILEHVTAGEFLELWAQEWDEYKVRKRNEYETWVRNQESDMTTWEANFKSELLAWEAAVKEAYLIWQNEQKAIWGEEWTRFQAWEVGKKDDFDEWFANLHYILDGDVAGHLQNEIEEIWEKEFDRYYEICAKSTHFNRDGNGNITSIVSTDEDDITMTTVFSKFDEDRGTRIQTTIDKGVDRWIKTIEILGDDVTQTIQKNA